MTKHSPAQVSASMTSVTPGPWVLLLYGHNLHLSINGDVECDQCEMAVETPDIIQQSSGFVQVVYKLHAIGQFKYESCEVDIEDVVEDGAPSPSPSPINDKKPYVGPKPGRTYWSDSKNSLGDIYTAYR